jgi:hypothetical protein
MKQFDEVDDPRRRLLIQALTAGLFTTGLPATNAWANSLFGNKPEKMPIDRSIYRISGQATVNGVEATLQTGIKPGDIVQTGNNSELVFVVNSHAMILRSNSHLVIEAGSAKAAEIKANENEPAVNKQEETSSIAQVINGLLILSGKLLSVSRNSPMKVRTATATIGIRGTGFYVESDPERTYFCTCYGTTEAEANGDADSKTTIVSEHHDRPLYILNGQGAGNNIRSAPLINHTDQELTLIETLVGRTPPFVFANDSYSSPRRNY